MSALSISSISRHGALLAFKGLPQLALDDVVANVVDLFVAQLAIAQAADRVVFVQSPARPWSWT